MKSQPLRGSFYYLQLSFIKSQPLRGCFRTCLYGPALLSRVTCPVGAVFLMESVVFLVTLPHRGSLLIDGSAFFIVNLPRRGFLLIETTDS